MYNDEEKVEWDLPSVDDVDALFAPTIKIRNYPRVQPVPKVSIVEVAGLEQIDTSTAHRWNQTRRDVERARAWPRRFIKRDGSIVICRNSKELKREKSKDNRRFLLGRMLVVTLVAVFVGCVYVINTQ